MSCDRFSCYCLQLFFGFHLYTPLDVFSNNKTKFSFKISAGFENNLVDIGR